jgi:hypothetical protein
VAVLPLGSGTNTELSVPVGQFRPCQKRVPESAKTRSKTLDEWITDLWCRYSAPSPPGLGWWQFRAFTNAADSEVLAGADL